MPEYAGPRKLRQLLEAVMSVGTDLDLTAMLQRIVEAATALVDARYGALGVLDESGTRLARFIPVGIDDETHRAIGHLPEGHGILGLLITDSTPLRLPDLNEHPDSYGFPPNHPPMTSFLGVPIRLRDKVFGNLYLTDKTTGEVFTDVDEELAVGLAAAAGVAIENARLHHRVQELRLVEDRERIARDLHDTVIQRLFATGLSLQGTIPVVRTDAAAAVGRVEAAIDDLDLTVKQVRSAIFGLEAARLSSESLRVRVLDTAREARGILGFEPSVFVDGPVDSGIGDELAADLLATLSEALTNVARHAGADRVDIELTADHEQVRLCVSDNGVGPPEGEPQTGNGLRNMAARAERHRGTATLEAGSPGSILKWSASRS